MHMSDSLRSILARPDIWQSGRHAAANEPRHCLPSGHPALDAALHQGGWPRATLTELLATSCGIGEMQLIAPALAQLSQGAQQIFFVAPPHTPYAPALHALGLRLERLVVLTPEQPGELFWSLEQILRSGVCGCLLGWLPGGRGAVDYTMLRRLQIAARHARGPVFLFRDCAGTSLVSPAALRIRLQHETAGLALEILKQRGGRAGQRILLSRPSQLLASQVVPALLPVIVRGNTTSRDDADAELPVDTHSPQASSRLQQPALH